MQWFGPSRDEVWRQLAEEIEASFQDGGFWKKGRVQAEHGPWTITLDEYTAHQNNHNQTYTRLRAPYVNPDGFRFTIYRKSIFSGLGKFLGMQDLEIGDPVFDDAFILKSNDEAKLRMLLSDLKLRDRFHRQPTLNLTVRDSEGWFGPKFPDNVDELCFQVHGVIKDIERLKSLFELFAVVLDQLCKIGSAYRTEPEVSL